jgi:hypothetical protein
MIYYIDTTNHEWWGRTLAVYRNAAEILGVEI